MRGAVEYPGPFAGADIRRWIRENVPAYPLQGPELPESIQTVVRLGVFLTDPSRVVLYGSQGRGDGRADSDFDLAFFEMRRPNRLSRLRADVDDEPITLRAVDILNIDEAGDALRQNVEREGRTVYERPTPTDC
jgi:predicted nucleotidyltransferase